MDEHSHEPRIALVTGANRGIGLEVARQLVARKCRVFIGARNPDRGRSAVQSLAGPGREIAWVQLDITDAAGIEQAAKRVEAEAGRLDILVNNAAILPDPTGSPLTIPLETMRLAFEVNTLGALRVTQALLPLLRNGDTPRIINVSSGAGSLDDMSNWAPAYSASKTALNAITLQFAAALKVDGIAVNAVCPGWVQTEMGGPNAPLPIEDGADTIVWLALDAPQRLTGLFLRERKVIPW